MENILYGTYDEIKKWYDSLEITKLDHQNLQDKYICNTEFLPFDKQLTKEKVEQVTMIGWFKTEVIIDKYNGIPEITNRLYFKKVCLKDN